MKMKFLHILLAAAFVGLLFLEGCAPKATTTAIQTGGKHSEDLSVYRPKIEDPVDTAKSNPATVDNTRRNPTVYVEARQAINAPLDAVLDSIDRINISNGLIDGFTIQLYSGVKREEALSIKKEMSIVLPKVDAEVQYVQPNFTGLKLKRIT
jgi:hypothetical protein